jgi:ABC-2 type transport system ATP-binding protein
MVMDYGRILVHRPAKEILDTFRRYRFVSNDDVKIDNKELWNTERIGNNWETYSFLPADEVKSILSQHGIKEAKEESLSLEDAFIGLTGKY